MIPNEVVEIVKCTKSVIPIPTYVSRQWDSWDWGRFADPESSAGKLGLITDSVDELAKAIRRWDTKDVPFLLLWAVPGLGKTHIALAITWQWLLSLQVRVMYYQVEILLDELRAAQFAEPGALHRLLHSLKSCRLLVLDDLGAEKGTEFGAAKLDAIIDHRYVNGLPTIITANTLELPDRILDRCREGTLVRIRGESQRGR